MTENTSKYYTSDEHLRELFDRESRKLAFNAETIAEYEQWKATVRTKLIELTGLNKMETCELTPQLLETTAMDGYQRQKMIIQTEPGVWMPFYVLTPNGLNSGEKHPTIIAAHGHGSGGKECPAGRTDLPELQESFKTFNYDYGVKFVQQGYIVYCPDARGFGERREVHQQGDGGALLGSSCNELAMAAICLGQTLAGMWVWDLMRLIDYIEACENCDPSRIGCVGLSGGGLQTLWLSVFDDRVKCAVVSGYFYGYKDALLMAGHCFCNHIPHVYENVDMGDLGALIAPRALLIESGSEDYACNGKSGIVNTTEQVEITRRAYQLLNAEDKLYHHIFDGPHMWHGEKSYAFVNKWISA